MNTPQCKKRSANKDIRKQKIKRKRNKKPKNNDKKPIKQKSIPQGNFQAVTNIGNKTKKDEQETTVHTI